MGEAYYFALKGRDRFTQVREGHAKAFLKQVGVAGFELATSSPVLGPDIHVWVAMSEVRTAETSNALASAFESLRTNAAMSDTHRNACASTEYLDLVVTRLWEHAARAWVLVVQRKHD